MSLKINNETITAQDLTGGNSGTRYFNTDLTQLVPNKEDYKLLGSPLQREQLKRMANGNIPYALTYEPKISNIVNPGDNTDMYYESIATVKCYNDFLTANDYIITTNNFDPQDKPWEIVACVKVGSTPSTNQYSSFCKCYNLYSNIFYWEGTRTPKAFAVETSQDGSNRWFSLYSNINFETNKWYWLKLNFTGTAYIYSISEDGKNFVTQSSYSSSNKVAASSSPAPYIFGGGTQPSDFYIRIRDCYIKIDDEYTFNGATAVEGTDYTVVGNPTITEEQIPLSVPSPFTFSFDVDSSTFTQGTKYLLEHPNLMKVKTENNNLYFNFPWRNNNWCNVDAESQKMFYAYTDGNGNTIYTPDENLQGTFKSLNTNDYDNYGDTQIDADGIASFTDGSTYLKANKDLFGSGFQTWTLTIRMGNQVFTPWTDFVGFKDGDVEPFYVGRWGEAGKTRMQASNNNSSYGPEAWATEVPYTGNGFLTYNIYGGNGSTYFTDQQQWGLNYTTSAAYFNGTRIYFGHTSVQIDLVNTYLVINGIKKTLAILNTTSNLYNSSFSKITPTTAENYNNVIVVDGITYTRDTSKDGIKNVPILITGINSIALTAPEALLQIPYYAYTYNNDSVYTKTLSLSTRKNSSVQGSLTIDGSNYSGFSSSNYIQTINFDPQDKPWEIVIKAKFNSSGQVGFCATKSQRAWNTYWNGNGVNVELSSNNSGWNIGSISHTTTFVSDNTTWYWMKFEFTGSQYIYSVKSQNDADYIVQGNPITSSTPIYTNGHPIPLTLGIDNGGSAMPAATIDLSDCYFKIGNEVTNFNSTILLNSLYDSQFQKLTYEQNPEVLNNDIIIDNNTYVRTQANDLTQILETTDKIKLVVNNHNFTLTDGDLPSITTGVLGYREDLEF